MLYSANSNQNPLINAEDHEVDFKDVLAMLLQYKTSIILVTLIALLIAGSIAYLKNNIYQADLTLQIENSASSSSPSQNDFMAAATGMPSVNIANEVVILKSRFIAQKTLEKIQIGNRYYDASGYKKRELYTQSPFTVDATSLEPHFFGAEFHITPLDKSHFHLKIQLPANEKFAGFTFEKNNSYEIPIKTSQFQITVHKQAELSAKEYIFTITPNAMMYPLVQGSLSVTPSEDRASVLMLTYTDNVPQRAQDILNAIAAAYSEQSIKNKSDSAEKTITFIDDQLKSINDSLQSSASKLRDYKASHMIIDVAGKATLSSTDLDKYQSDMYEYQMQESTLKNLLEYVKKDKDLVGIDLGTVSGNSQLIGDLIGKIQEAHTQRSSLLVDFTDKHPSVIKINKQIESLNKSLIGTIEGSLRSIEQRKISLNQLINKKSGSLAALPQEEKDLTQLQRDFTINEDIYKFLLQKRSETAIIESSTASGVHIIDAALSSWTSKQPNRLLIIAMGFIIGLILGILQAFARNVISNNILTISDIENNTKLPIYGILPLFKEKKTLYEDALRMLFTRVVHSSKKPKIITVTSSVKGEGRTTTALEFAKIMGQSAKKVVLLNMDMRASRVKDQLSISNEHGISSYLSGNNTFAEVVYSINEQIDVIPAGPTPANPYEMITSQQFQILLTELSQKYDYILLESPPVGLVADALVLMRMSDLNLIIMKVGYSKKNFITNMNRFVYEHNLDNVGIVLNASSLKKIRPWLRK
jgi:capsular exopolysaccharide synthesis family protein